MSNPVTVTDVQMPFMSMVTFMVKWAIASIPAVMILLTCAMSLSMCGAALIGVSNGL
jgi:hypothetical protein